MISSCDWTLHIRATMTADDYTCFWYVLNFFWWQCNKWRHTTKKPHIDAGSWTNWCQGIMMSRLNHFHIKAQFYLMTDSWARAQRSCCHSRCERIQPDSATTVVTSIQEPTIHKSTVLYDAQCFHTQQAIQGLIRPVWERLFLHPFSQIFPLTLCVI